MTTQIQDIPTAESTEAVESPFSETEIRDAVGNVDLGQIANTCTDDEDRWIYRYLRLRSNTLSEITRVKDQLDAWVKEQQNRVNGLDYFWFTRTQEWARRKLEGQKTKSIKTPFGTVGFRTNPGGLMVEDESELIAAITLADDDSPLKQCYRLEPVVKKAELNEHFKASGEIPSGCVVKDAEEKFYVK